METPTRGFTLLDLLIALTISASLITLGLPPLTQLTANYKADSQYQQLFALVQFARSQSVFYGQQVVVCPSTNNSDCLSDWHNSLLVFVDANNNEVFDNGDTLLKIQPETSDDSKRLWNAFGGSRYLRFNYDGRYASQNGRLTYCLDVGSTTYARQIIIANTGRPRKGEESDALSKCGA